MAGSSFAMFDRSWTKVSVLGCALIIVKQFSLVELVPTQCTASVQPTLDYCQGSFF